MNLDLTSYEETEAILKSAMNKIIKKVWLNVETDCLHFQFTDGTGMILFDQHLSGEYRTMTTTDELTLFYNTIFLGIAIKPAPSYDTEFGIHEIQFLDIKTDKGVFQMVNHNDHDGTYSGFRIAAKAF